MRYTDDYIFFGHDHGDWLSEVTDADVYRNRWLWQHLDVYTRLHLDSRCDTANLYILSTRRGRGL